MSNVRLTTCFALCLLATLCVAGQVRAAFPYTYTDNFTTDNAASDAYIHSAFLPQGWVPLPEPYLYYIDIGRNRGLAFADYKGQQAQLGYSFPPTSASPARAVKGFFALDVSFPSQISQSSAGRLEYQTSPDGTGWSAPQELEAGHHEIPLTSAGGVCYILFSGTGVVIDDIDVYLTSPPTTIRVPQNYATIQDAINHAGAGDVIEVAKGTYRGPGNRDIDFGGKAITVRGAAGAAGDTIIDCEGLAAKAQGGHRGFYFHQSEGPDSVLSDLTIHGGWVLGSQVPPDPLRRTPNAKDPIGGGIYCALSGPTIANCIIEDCGAELGGGIGGVGATPTIENCTFQECFAGGTGPATTGGRGGAIGLIGNSNATITSCIFHANAGYNSSYGAGLYFQQGTATVAGCTIAENTAFSVRGGGAFCGAASDVTFRNCIFSRNKADAGAGICAEGATDASLPLVVSSKRGGVNVVNCTIAQNELLPGAVTGAAGGMQSSGADVVVTSSILYYNKGKALVIADSALRDTITYSDIEGGYSGAGNINMDPLFVSLSPEDYHLQSTYGRYDPGFGRWVSDQDGLSPCIDTGDPSASVGEELPPNGNRINMGAYGGTKQASQGPEHFIRHVNQRGGNDWNSGLTPEQALATVQKAIDMSDDGDTVLVWPGTYQEDLDFTGKAITVQSAADAAVLTAHDSYAVTFDTGERGGSVLANFVITGCNRAGIFCYSASPTLKNLTIVGNAIGIAAYEGADPNVTNCILWSNSSEDMYQYKAARFSNIQDFKADPAAGNIQRNPMFADLSRGDYHLMSQRGRYVSSLQTWVTDKDTSPCIDAGDPKDDYRAEPMPNGGRIDMGAYGGTPYASKSMRQN